MTDRDIQQIPVAIVGGGPVGLLLALFLDRYGVRSVVFNSEAEVRPHPKGSSHNSRTMEHHRRLGIAQNIRAFSLPPDRPTDVSYFTRLTGWELARLRMPSEAEKQRTVAASAATDQIPEPILRANQMYVEAFLLAHARTRKNITVRFGWQVDKFDDDDKGVTVEAEAVAGASKGARETWRAQYLVGCDGGRSFVRRSLALRYHGFAKLDAPHYGGRMIATHMRAPTLYRDHLARRHGWQYWVVNPDVRATIISLRGDEEFLIFSKAPDAAKKLPMTRDCPDMVRRAVGADFPLTMLDHRPWTAGIALVAEQFIAGRVVLAGDAAHLFTPTGGFGMNTGMDDTSNLSWKLAGDAPRMGREKSAAILRDRAQAGRRAQHDRGARSQCASGKSFGAGRDRTGFRRRRSRAAACERADFDLRRGIRLDRRAARRALRRIADHCGRTARRRPTTMCAIRRRAFRAGACRISGWTADAATAVRCSTGWVSASRCCGWAARRPMTGAIEQAARARNVPFEVLDIPHADARDLYERDLVLVRPDQYVAWRGNSPPPDPDRLLAQVIGATMIVGAT